MTGTAVETRGLRRTFGDFEAVAGVDLAVADGRDLRLPRAQRRRQVDAGEDAVHPAAALGWLGLGRRLRRGHPVDPGAAAHRGRPAGRGDRPEADRSGDPHPAGPLLRPAQGRDREPHGRRAGAGRHRRRHRQPHRHLLRRHAPSARPGRRPRAQPRGALPRRADDRPRPGQPPAGVGGGPPPQRRTGHDHLPDHAVPRGGRPAGRPGRHHQRRPDRGRGHARRAEAPDRHRRGHRRVDG